MSPAPGRGHPVEPAPEGGQLRRRLAGRIGDRLGQAGEQGLRVGGGVGHRLGQRGQLAVRYRRRLGDGVAKGEDAPLVRQPGLLHLTAQRLEGAGDGVLEDERSGRRQPWRPPRRRVRPGPRSGCRRLGVAGSLAPVFGREPPAAPPPRRVGRRTPARTSGTPRSSPPPLAVAGTAVGAVRPVIRRHGRWGGGLGAEACAAGTSSARGRPVSSTGWGPRAQTSEQASKRPGQTTPQTSQVQALAPAAHGVVAVLGDLRAEIVAQPHRVILPSEVRIDG